MSNIGIGLIGTGFMGKSHALAWHTVKATFGTSLTPRLEMLCEADEDLARQKADEYGFAHAITDWQALVSDPRVDVVSITTPNSLHRDMAIAALEAGKHVWCEKPMALTVEDAEAMTKAAAKSGTKTLLGYNYVRNPALQHARRLIQEGAIGRIVDFRGQVDEDYLANEDLTWTWRCRIDQGGLGVLGDITCHLVSLAHYLVGDITDLSATIETAYPTRPLGDGSGQSGAVENEDIAHSLVKFENGIKGILASSRVAWGRKNVIRVEIHGTKGMICFDQERMNELELYLAEEGDPANRGMRKILTGPAHEPYGQFCPAPGHQLGINDLKCIEASQFLDAIDQDDEAWPNFAEGLKIEKIIHGMARSSEEGRWISVK